MAKRTARELALLEMKIANLEDAGVPKQIIKDLRAWLQKERQSSS